MLLSFQYQKTFNYSFVTKYFITSLSILYVSACFSELQKQTKTFRRHTYVKRVQASAFMQEVIEVDFAENYTLKTQNEIQMAYYWAYDSVILFTVCAWEKHGTHSLIV